MLLNRVESGIDQKFRLSRIIQTDKSSLKHISAGGAVKNYRSFVAPSLFTRCKWYPSDSQFAMVLQNKCGSIHGGIAAFARFSYEEDASRMGYGIFNDKGQIKYVDMPASCSF